MGKIIRSTIVFLIVAILLASCDEQKNLPKETNAFIQHFLDLNAERIYKSEIQRVKVNYFPSSNALIYSFWKKEKFEENGQLYLHLYPTDLNNLNKNRIEHKFVNIPQQENEWLHVGQKYFYHFQYVQQPFDLKAIQTGQYNDTSKTWLADYKNGDILKFLSKTKRALVVSKNVQYAISYFNDLESILGPVVLEDTLTESFHYNASLGALSVVSRPQDGSRDATNIYFVDSYSKTDLLERQLVALNDSIKSTGVSVNKIILPIDRGLETFKIGKIIGDDEVIVKEIKPHKLVHASHFLGSKKMARNNGSKDLEIEMISHLFLDNIPLVYFDNDFQVFLNAEKRNLYIICGDGKGQGLEKVRLHSASSNDTLVQQIDLDDAFVLKGNSRELIVNEFQLPKDVGLKFVEVYKDNLKIYQKVFN